VNKTNQNIIYIIVGIVLLVLFGRSIGLFSVVGINCPEFKTNAVNGNYGDSSIWIVLDVDNDGDYDAYGYYGSGVVPYASIFGETPEGYNYRIVGDTVYIQQGSVSQSWLFTLNYGAASNADLSCESQTTHYSCSGEQCVEDVNGQYISSDCDGECTAIPEPTERYKCDGISAYSTCVRDDVNGIYTSSTCDNQCNEPPTSGEFCLDSDNGWNGYPAWRDMEPGYIADYAKYYPNSNPSIYSRDGNDGEYEITYVIYDMGYAFNKDTVTYANFDLYVRGDDDDGTAKLYTTDAFEWGSMTWNNKPAKRTLLGTTDKFSDFGDTYLYITDVVKIKQAIVGNKAYFRIEPIEDEDDKVEARVLFNVDRTHFKICWNIGEQSQYHEYSFTPDNKNFNLNVGETKSSTVTITHIGDNEAITGNIYTLTFDVTGSTEEDYLKKIYTYVLTKNDK